MTFSPEPTDHSFDRLSGDDAAALDAFVDAGFELSQVPEAMRPRAQRVAQLLGLLDCPVAQTVAPEASSSLCARTLRSIELAKVAGAVQASTVDAVLSVDDEEALDALVAAGYRADRVNSALRERAVQLEAIGAMLTAADPSSHGSADLAARTLNRIKASPVMTPSESGGVVGRIGVGRLADLFSIAAAAVLGVSVLWPVLSAWRHHSTKTLCGSNMATVAGAMGTYANDYRSQMPVATASLLGPTWWDVGTSPGRSNSANLFQLPKLKYTKLNDLACPGNPSADQRCACEGREDDWSCASEVSYSYQVMFSKIKPQWGELSASGPMVVLADKSPVVARSRLGQAVNPLENSPNHGGDGQWTVRTDGSGAWLVSPQNGEDNIWMPAAIDRGIARVREELRRTGVRAARVDFMLLGNELQTEPGNTFVGP
jgi:hypothetical protein